VNVAEGEHHHDRRRLPPSRPRLAAVAALALWTVPGIEDDTGSACRMTRIVRESDEPGSAAP
jgi:hypothetical protein